MKLALLVTVLALLAGCAADTQKLSVCDGKHRREANPYGSVLPGAPAATAGASSAPPAKLDARQGGGCGRLR